MSSHIADISVKMDAKRIMDVVGAGLALLVLSPLLACVALCVLAVDGWPAFYVATRVGQCGKPFRQHKFRTMVPSGGSSVTVWADPRVTRLGRVLRRYKLDELPQFLDVLRGDMSLVGPRPEDPSYVALYTAEQRRVLESKPGITGFATLRYVDEDSLLQSLDAERVYREEIMPAKLELEISYAERRSVWTDCFLLVETAVTLVRRVTRSAQRA